MDTEECVGDEIIVIDEQEEEELSKISEQEQSDAEELALRVIRAAAQLKMVKIDREKFLRAELQKHCPRIDANLAVADTPAIAGVPPEVLDAIAIEAIDLESKKCSALSFAAGIPGGLAMAGTVPADLAQYFAHVMRIEQKLAYVYGWQSFLENDDEIDDESLAKFIMLLGIMMNVGTAANAINAFANQVAMVGVQKTIQKQALTKTVFYPILKKILRLVGVQLTKETFAKAVSKMVPVVGGVISGGLTYATFKPGAENLRRYLRELPCSGIEPGTPDVYQHDVVADATHAVADGAAAAGGAIVAGAAVAADVAAKAGTAVVGGAAQVGEIAANGAAAAGEIVAAGADVAAGAAMKAGAMAVEGVVQAGSVLADGAANIGKFLGSLGKR